MTYPNVIDPLAARFAASISRETGGGTFAVPSLYPLHPTRGYAVGRGDVTVVRGDDLNGLVDGIQRKASLISGRCCVGTWRNESGDFEIESASVETRAYDAFRLARECDQRYIYDFAKRESLAVPNVWCADCGAWETTASHSEANV